MYEGIIDALTKLFTLLLHFGNKEEEAEGHSILSKYLQNQFGPQVAEQYIQRYESLVKFHNLKASKYPDFVELYRQEEIETVGAEINTNFELDIRQQIIVRLYEFAQKDQCIENFQDEILETIRKTLNICDEECMDIKQFALQNFSSMPNKNALLVIDNNELCTIHGAHHIHKPEQQVTIFFLYIPSSNQLFVNAIGQRNLYMNGHKLTQKRAHAVPQGAILKTSRMEPVYYNNVITMFTHKDQQNKLTICVKDVQYRFSKNVIGIHPFSLVAKSGDLVGIMGGSGVGKSTLINLLNGNIKPQQGSIFINDIDLHKHKQDLQGIIGYVPQDDLLIEELTVYENLYYNAKLCFSGTSEDEINQKVEHALSDFDLVEARDLQVGSPLKKIISGGQRKRLNIALELIRQPAILLVDEPTSGLSSSDSEKVMFLLKRQCLKGGLVFANIHQPSSDIYKMLDSLIILDKGGRIVYQGNPLDAITYFKHQALYVNPDQSECLYCGNVQAEQPLRIIEARMVSPTGRQIRKRKISAEEWYKMYQENIEPKIIKRTHKKSKDHELPENHFKVPNRRNQFKVFVQRDLRAKFYNKQYLTIALIQSPLLAFLLSYFTKFSEQDEIYCFGKNVNIAPYLFMSVVVALFVGLTVSAEEIFKDRRILKREQFLNLSRSSYLGSKILILFGLSAIQTLTFVLLGNWILEIKDMTLSYWLILFSTSCFANMLGLNLSSGLNSAVAIYISIPLLLVPQLLFSGVVVNFKNMHTKLSSAQYTPWIGDIMVARWGYEALAVNQFKNNKYEANYFDLQLKKYQEGFIFSNYIPALQDRIHSYEETLKRGNDTSVQDDLLTLQKSLPSLAKQTPLNYDANSLLHPTESSLIKLDSLLTKTGKQLNAQYQETSAQIDQLTQQLAQSLGGNEALFDYKMKYHNNKLDEIVRDRQELYRIREEDHLLVQNNNHIFQIATNPLGRAQFYAPYKTIGTMRISTVVYNILFIWIGIVFLGIALYFDYLKKCIAYFKNFTLRRLKLKEERKELLNSNHTKASFHA